MARLQIIPLADKCLTGLLQLAAFSFRTISPGATSRAIFGRRLQNVVLMSAQQLFSFYFFSILFHSDYTEREDVMRSKTLRLSLSRKIQAPWRLKLNALCPWHVEQKEKKAFALLS